MTATAVLTGVTGTDGIVPVYDPLARWCFWNMSEVFVGTAGKNKYVPKLLDFVIDFNGESYTTYVVDHLDPITLKPALREIKPANMSFTMSQTDILFGVGPGTQSDTYRLYVDKTVLPHLMAVDVRLKVGGTMTSTCKIFKGSDLGGTGEVISKVFDSTGTIVSESVKLELISIDSHINYSVKSVPVCHTTTNLLDGEIVTVVFYSDKGNVVSKRQLLVENTGFIRSKNLAQKYISSIHLESPFLSKTEDHVINFPLNIPINALNMVGVVNYSDGSTLKLPVDGTKFKILGLDQYISTIVGQEIELVLSYAISKEEVAYNGITSDGHYVTEPYSLKTINQNNSYSVKLFGYPKWTNAVTGYEMQWWLYNLDRNLALDVTDKVKYLPQTGTYNPLAIGYAQRKAVSINLQQVSGAFKPFVHTQLVDINLLALPGELETAWTVSNEAVEGRPVFGTKLYATRKTTRSLDITAGMTDYDKWYQAFYTNTYPLINKTLELDPPKPTHVVVEYGLSKSEIAIVDWNKDITLNTDIVTNKELVIKFIKKNGSDVLELSIAVVVIR